MLECDNGNFYTGYTKNLAIRYYQHKSGKQSAKYTRGFKPVRIAQCWRLFDSIGTALKVERFIKNQNRSTKLQWIQYPEDLKIKASKKMELDLNISPFDCLAVEIESEKMDWKKIKNGFDPFANFPYLASESNIPK
jgi:putative endonuclease